MGLSYTEIQAALNEKQKQLESFQAFFEDFNKYDLALSMANSDMMDIYTFIIEKKRSDPKDEKALLCEKNTNSVLHCLSAVQGLNSKCQTQKLTIKFQLLRIERLEQELKSIKEALNAE